MTTDYINLSYNVDSQDPVVKIQKELAFIKQELKRQGDLITQLLNHIQATRTTINTHPIFPTVDPYPTTNQ